MTSRLPPGVWAEMVEKSVREAAAAAHAARCMNPRREISFRTPLLSIILALRFWLSFLFIFIQADSGHPLRAVPQDKAVNRRTHSCTMLNATATVSRVGIESLCGESPGVSWGRQLESQWNWRIK